MIAFGCSITDPEKYKRCAEPGIALASEPDSVVLPHASIDSIFRSYNLLLDKAAELDDLEALVVVHQDAEIVDPEFCAKVRRAFGDPEVGVAGCVGAIGVRSIAWWDGSVTWASFVHRYGELGGGDLPAFSWDPDRLPAYAHTGEVDTVDGFVIAFSPWAVREVRFDESLGNLHGYDFDYCLQVRERGKKVVTEDFRVIHHHSLELISDIETWVEAHMTIAEKWDSRMPLVGGQRGGDWKQRARRAEADAAAGKAKAVTQQLKFEALERQFDEVRRSASWRLTAPLRRLRGLFRGSPPRS
ncbi:MAG: glycosyltransferase [Solirubrobacterales bacterium]